MSNLRELKENIECRLEEIEEEKEQMDELHELKEEIEQRLKEIEKDTRIPDREDYADEAATVQVNAPLAMIQATTDKERSTLRWVNDRLEAVGVA